jgi:hypothetical protein
LTEGYTDPNLKSLTREFLWIRPSHEPSQLIITDHAGFRNTPSTYQEIFICGVVPKHVEDGKIAIGTVQMYFNANEWSFVVEPISTLNFYVTEKKYYRLMLNRNSVNVRMESQFRFVIT